MSPRTEEKFKEKILDFKVRVNPSKVLKYPKFKKELCDPVLEIKEPYEYDLVLHVDLWLHQDQHGHKKVSGYVIYDYLKTHDELQNHLNFGDLLAIQAKGVEVFRQLYANKAVYAWASVIHGDNGNLYVPYMCAYLDDVVMKWRCLSNATLDSLSPGLFFKKSKKKTSRE